MIAEMTLLVPDYETKVESNGQPHNEAVMASFPGTFLSSSESDRMAKI